MKRILAVWLPNWSAQRLGRLEEKSEVRNPKSEINSNVSNLEFGDSDLVSDFGFRISDFSSGYADRQALIELAQWCHRFTPTTGLEEGEAPETLLLDATNLAPLYGGEEPFVAQVMHALRRRGYAARAALADTLGAAWAVAHFREHRASGKQTASGGRQPPVVAVGVPPFSALTGELTLPARLGANATIVPPGQSPAALAPLPIAALRLPDDLRETLDQLGAREVGDLLALPRDQLRSRFGPLLALRIDQALGEAREVFAAVDPSEHFVVEQELEFPLARHDAVRLVVETLLERLTWLLAARCAGALRVVCRFDCEGAPPVELEASLFQPSASARHLLEIVELEFERLRLPGPATAVAIAAAAHAPLAQRQGVLFDEDRSLGASLRLSALVNRLVARLGRESVVRCRLQSEAQPELACREEPLIDGRPKPRQRAPAAAARRITWGPLDRPLHLLPRPAPLETLSVVPDGPPIHFRRGGREHHVMRQWGPERIETGWWRGRTTGRDYYRVETTAGRRFWLYRRRRDGRWFLHGVYE